MKITKNYFKPLVSTLEAHLPPFLRKVLNRLTSIGSSIFSKIHKGSVAVATLVGFNKKLEGKELEYTKLMLGILNAMNTNPFMHPATKEKFYDKETKKLFTEEKASMCKASLCDIVYDKDSQEPAAKIKKVTFAISGLCQGLRINKGVDTKNLLIELQEKINKDIPDEENKIEVFLANRYFYGFH